MDADLKKHIFLLGLVALAFLWAFIRPYDYLTLILEIIPVVAGLIILIYWSNTGNKRALRNFRVHRGKNNRQRRERFFGDAGLRQRDLF